MRRTWFLRAASLFFGAAALAGQTAPPRAMPEALRAHVSGERFDLITSIRGLPLGVRNDLERLWQTQTLDIAEPGEPFQGSGATVNRSLPTRRLIAAGCSGDHHCLVYYERGGATHTWLAALYQWTPAESRFEWGGTAPGGLKTIEEVQKAVLSGQLSPSALW